MPLKPKRVNWTGLMRDPEYVKRYNRKIIPKNMSIIEDSLIGRNANFAQRVGVLSLVVAEHGGDPNAHGNGAEGIAGWRGSRKTNLPRTLSGLIHKMMVDIYNGTDRNAWTHGGVNTGVKTGEKMRNLFLNTQNSTQATNAFMKGYVRPETTEYNTRLGIMNLLKKYMK